MISKEGPREKSAGVSMGSPGPSPCPSAGRVLRSRYCRASSRGRPFSVEAASRSQRCEPLLDRRRGGRRAWRGLGWLLQHGASEGTGVESLDGYCDCCPGCRGRG